jgi:hypothetical protein
MLVLSNFHGFNPSIDGRYGMGASWSAVCGEPAFVKTAHSQPSILLLQLGNALETVDSITGSRVFMDFSSG